MKSSILSRDQKMTNDELPILDRPFRAFKLWYASRGRPLVSARLSDTLIATADEVIAEHRVAATELAQRIVDGDGAARGELADLADRGFSELREISRARAREMGGATELAARFDSFFEGGDAVEHIDDPDFPEKHRVAVMASLDHMNEVLECYDCFLDSLGPFLRSDGPTTVLDLAAGHGGFCLAVARMARERGIDIRFTASDIKREYLDMGDAQARAEGLPIEFVLQDALDLSNLEAGAYDIVTCTQSLHHFSPGMIAVMFEAATHAAGRGIMFLDGCRSAVAGVALAGYGLLRRLHLPSAHDSWVSSRRFFMPEELGFLARLGPWGDGVEATWVPPGHCMVRLEL